MVQNIYIIDESNELKKITKDLFKSTKKYCFKQVTTKNVDIALKNIPDLIIINEDSLKENISTVYEKFKKNDDNRITPIMVVSSNIEKKHRVETLKYGVEYYIKKPIDEEYFYYTIKNILELIHTNRTVSPLTGLPRKRTNSGRNEKKTIKFRIIFNDVSRYR